MNLIDLRRIVHNWPAKVLSLACALFLFLIVQNTSLAQREMITYVQVQMPPGFAAAEPPERMVTVTLRGPADQIYTVLPEHIKLKADFSDVSEPGRHWAFIRLEAAHESRLFSPLEIDYRPRRIEAVFERSSQ